MRPKIVPATLVLLLIAMTAGCATTRGTYRSPRLAMRGTLFNSQFTLSSPEDEIRDQWPVAIAYEFPQEEIQYEELILDYQGRFGSAEDQLYRRFSSRRKGTGRR